MDNKQAAKSVLKKLSALRATLPDDEQTYLDHLIMGLEEENSSNTSPGLEEFAADGTVTHPKPDSGNQPENDHKRTTAEISWNNIMEIYELE